MELRIDFPSLPAALTLDQVKMDLATLLEEDGWLLASGGNFIELELEDEKNNPKYGILTVKNYLQKAGFCPQTTIELSGVAVGIFE